jgi:hypothetical protein
MHGYRVGGIDHVERANRLHRHWTLWLGQGNRGPRHLGSRHVSHFHWEAFTKLNPDEGQQLRKDIDSYAVARGALDEIRDVVQGPTKESNRTGIGSNPKITYVNAYMENVTKFKGHLEEAAWIGERARALREWELHYANNEPAYLLWYHQYRRKALDKRQERIIAELNAQMAGANRVDNELASPWSAGVGRLPVDPSVLDGDLRASNRHGDVSLRTNPRCLEMRNEERYLVRDADAGQVDLLPLDDVDWGCLAQTKNICCTINRHRMREIDHW